MTIEELKLHKARLGWRCGKCGKMYDFHEFIELIDVNSESGRMPMCPCGYVFLQDKWKLQDKLKIKINDKEFDILVSTIYLEINHGFFDKDLWYETMVFEEDLEGIVESRYIDRYDTEEQAIVGHNKILELVKSGNYEVVT